MPVVQQQPADRLVPVNETVLRSLGVLRTENGSNLGLTLSDVDPDTGLSEMVINLTEPDPVDLDEVLFSTSSSRIYDAYIRWFSLVYPRGGDNSDQAAIQTRSLLKYLQVPTAREVAAYREREYQNQ